MSKLLLTLKSKFWFLPIIYGLSAALFALLSVWIDNHLHEYDAIYRDIPSFLFTDIDLARTILGAIATSLLTMTSITFSTILVVLTTYLSEFSPRALQNFVTDRFTQSVLGIFVGGFIYSILLLLLLNDDDTNVYVFPAVAVLLAIVCLVMFIFYVHHVASWIQVSNLVHMITTETMERIDIDFDDEKDVQADPPWEDWESEEISNTGPTYISGNKSGYHSKELQQLLAYEK